VSDVVDDDDANEDLVDDEEDKDEGVVSVGVVSVVALVVKMVVIPVGVITEVVATFVVDEVVRVAAAPDVVVVDVDSCLEDSEVVDGWTGPTEVETGGFSVTVTVSGSSLSSMPMTEMTVVWTVVGTVVGTSLVTVCVVGRWVTVRVSGSSVLMTV
jgi:hypothetical protein